MIAKYVAMRTNDTGLWGLAVVLPNLLSGKAWDFITAKAGENAVVPLGLAGAGRSSRGGGRAGVWPRTQRDDRPRNGGAGRCGGPWPRIHRGGAIREIKARGASRKLVGLVPGGRRAGVEQGLPARHPSSVRTTTPGAPAGTPVYLGDGAECGTITSGIQPGNGQDHCTGVRGSGYGGAGKPVARGPEKRPAVTTVLPLVR